MTAPAPRVLAWLNARHDAMLDVLAALVDMDTPTADKARVDAAMRRVAELCEANGAEVSRVPETSYGDPLMATWPGSGSARSVLVLAHLDTVWPEGECARRPFKREAGTLTGPGIFDMKAGLVQALFAISALQALAVEPRPTTTLLVTTDEEAGSPVSRALIEREAGGRRAVLVVEPSSDGGALKTARKGIGMYELSVHGRAAHAGVEPERGRSAVLELAHQIQALHAMSDPARGITVTVGTVSGGSRRNVVPAEAHAAIDLRVVSAAQADEMHARITGLEPAIDGVSLSVEGGINRPPMERTAQVEALYELASSVARELDMPLAESSSGGGSDGNFTAALGVPTLDGLGAVGGGPHALSEHVLEEHVPLRAALLAGVLAGLA